MSEEFVTFKLPARSLTDEHKIHYCTITDDTTLKELKAWLLGEFGGTELKQLVWGKKTIDPSNEDKRIAEIIQDLNTDGSFDREAILVATFNFVGGF